MATKESVLEDNKQYEDAFNEEVLPPAELSEDEAFGLNLPPADGEGQSASETDGAPIATQAGEAIEPGAADMAGGEVPPGGEMAPEGPGAMPPMSQAERSWEGRLRKREEELRAIAGELQAREAQLMAAQEQLGAQARGQGPEVPAAADGGGVAAAVVADGQMDAATAAKQLSEEFGEDFVSMINAIATNAAAKTTGTTVQAIGDTVSNIIADIKDGRQQRHFKEIYRAHPDAFEIAESAEFQAWIDALPPNRQADVAQVIAEGDSDDINALLAEYKQSIGGEDSGKDVPEAEIDAAEGVRSTGLRLPVEPAAGKDDYEASWGEFKD